MSPGNYHRFLFVLSLFLVFCRPASAGDQEKHKSPLRKVAANDQYATILINNLFNYYSNNGDGSFNPFVNDGALEYQKGSGGIVVFEDGLVWGCFQNGVKKVGGSTYNHALQAGKIITEGTVSSPPVAENPSFSKNRMYRVRRDIAPVTDPAEARRILDQEEVPLIERYEGSTITAEALYARYLADWNEWPALEGAPFEDKDGNGTYEPGMDVPGVRGADQTLWFVANDMDSARTIDLYGSTPIGLEIQETIWAYRLSGLAGNILFARHKLINKSGIALDSMFVSQFADPDIGGALGFTDDFAGVDTSRRSGFAYNGDSFDGFYGNRPPAVGYTLLQGGCVPGLPSDSILWDFKSRKGMKDLGLTSSNFFIGGNSTYSDPRLKDSRGTDEMYNLMNGLLARTGTPYTNPITGLVTKYPLNGDPVTGAGWLDGSVAPPGDRRIMVNSGPFAMAPGDTQEIHIAAGVGQGADRLSSVSVMRYIADLALAAGRRLFQVGAAPPAPLAKAITLDNQVVLDWSDPMLSQTTENFQQDGYSFQGYNVYQLSDRQLTAVKKLLTFDKKDGIQQISDWLYDDQYGVVVYVPVQQGTDSGIKRFFGTVKDALTGDPLVNGRPYYYAVTSFSYNPLGLPKTFETPLTIIEAVPQSPRPGEVLHSRHGQLIQDSTDVMKIGINAGKAFARVVDPSAVTGHDYVIHFTIVDSQKVWGIKDSTTGAMKMSGIRVFGDVSEAPVVDGLQFVVLDPEAVGGFVRSALVRIGTDDVPFPFYNVMRNTSYGFGFDVEGATSPTTAFQRLNWQSAADNHDYEVRFVAALQGSEWYRGNPLADVPKAASRVPFQLWDITMNTRLAVRVDDKNGNGIYDTTSGLTVIGYGLAWEPIYATRVPPYQEPLPPTSGINLGPEQPFGRLLIVPLYPPDLPSPGTVVRLVTRKPIQADGSHSFTMSTAKYQPEVGNREAAVQTTKKINIYPNPYFGFNRDESSKYFRFVTFNHLPQRAVIRIFTLGGALVRTLLKDDPGQFQRWDLLNERGYVVASGIYLIHITLPDLGEERVLKFSVIQEQPILDHY